MSEPIRITIDVMNNTSEIDVSMPLVGLSGKSAQSDWAQTNNTALDFIKNKPEWVKGVIALSINEPELNTLFEEGIYKIYKPHHYGIAYDLYDMLIVSKANYADRLSFCRQVWIDSFSQIKERKYSNGAWSAWETYAYQSDLTPILSNITALQNGKLDKAGGSITGNLNMNNHVIEEVLSVHASAMFVNYLTVISIENHVGEISVLVDFLMGGNRIKGLPTPVDSLEAANKEYVDATVADKPSAVGFTSIEVVDEYPDVEVEGVLYLKKVTA